MSLSHLYRDGEGHLDDDDDDERENFEITDWDLQNEFNPNRQRHWQTKEEATYGVWAERDSDEERPSFGGKRARDYSAPVNFISAGLKKGAAEEADSEDSDAEEKPVKQEDFPKDLGPKKLKTGGNFKPSQKGFSGGTKSFMDFGSWERHTKGIGQKLLQKMGYVPGRGLGKNAQGIINPIEAKQRKGKEARMPGFALPELEHNLQLLIERTEQEIIQSDRQLQYERDMVVSLSHELEKTAEVLAHEERVISNLSKVLALVEECERRMQPHGADPLTLDECARIFETLQDKYYEEYRLADRADLAVADSEEEAEEEFQKELSQWRKDPSGSKKKPKYSYKTVEELKAKGRVSKKLTAPQKELSQVKVIDMTGRERTVLLLQLSDL